MSAVRIVVFHRSEAADPWGALSLFQEDVDLTLHLKTQREEETSDHGLLAVFIHIVCDAGKLPRASVVWGGAGPGGSGGRCWSGTGPLPHPTDHCWVCATGSLPYRCCLANWPPAWRNHTPPPPLPPLAHPLHRQTWLLEHTWAGLEDTDKGFDFNDCLLIIGCSYVMSIFPWFYVFRFIICKNLVYLMFLYILSWKRCRTSAAKHCYFFCDKKTDVIVKTNRRGDS